jgi:hypothetical protein
VRREASPDEAQAVVGFAGGGGEWRRAGKEGLTQIVLSTWYVDDVVFDCVIVEPNLPVLCSGCWVGWVENVAARPVPVEKVSLHQPAEQPSYLLNERVQLTQLFD